MKLRDIFKAELDSRTGGTLQGLSCPNCRHAIPPDDVNVARDIALCRNCGRTSAFSTLAGMSEFADVDIDKPPKHIRLERDISGDLIIRYKKMSPVLLFLIPFTLLWSGGSMWGLYISQIIEGKFDIGRTLFGLPFLIGTIVLVSVIIFCLLGRWEITLGDGEGRVFVGVGRLGWTRRFNYNDDSTISLKLTNYSVNEVQQKGICVSANGKDFVFGAGMSDESKAYIAAFLDSVVRRRGSVTTGGQL